MQQDIRLYYVPIKVVDQNLCCNICKQLALNPVECLKCENIFCKNCVETKIKIKDKYQYQIDYRCPQNCEGTFETKMPHRMVREQFSKISFRCINQKKGCQEEIHFDDVMNHVQNCKYQSAKCICDWTGLKANLEQHQSQCEHLKTSTCSVCKLELTLVKMKNHNCVNDIQAKLNMVADKFYEYKETSEFAIKELKSQVRTSFEEAQTLRNEIAKIRSENVLLAEQLASVVKSIEARFSQKAEAPKQQQQQFQESPKKQAQESPNKQQQQDSLFGQGLTEAQEACCQNGHKLYFWKRPQQDNEEKQNKCVKCDQKLMNTKYAYVCVQCKVPYCLKCQNPEILFDKQKNKIYCPQKKAMVKFESENFKCSVCDKKGQDMVQPIAIRCEDCGFVECYQCIKHKKYWNKQQDINIL